MSHHCVNAKSHLNHDSFNQTYCTEALLSIMRKENKRRTSLTPILRFYYKNMGREDVCMFPIV